MTDPLPAGPYNRIDRAATLIAAQRGCPGIMQKARDGFETRPPDASTLDAANEPMIAGAHRPSGWDPFEIWRTRVRALRRGLPREGKDKKG
jgi:hypothetical protein